VRGKMSAIRVSRKVSDPLFIDHFSRLCLPYKLVVDANQVARGARRTTLTIRGERQIKLSPFYTDLVEISC
jgi:hypothetical protein